MYVILLFSYIILPTPFVLDSPFACFKTLRSILVMPIMFYRCLACASRSLSKFVDIVCEKGKTLVNHPVVCERDQWQTLRYVGNTTDL